MLRLRSISTTTVHRLAKAVQLRWHVYMHQQMQATGKYKTQPPLPLPTCAALLV